LTKLLRDTPLQQPFSFFFFFFYLLFKIAELALDVVFACIVLIWIPISATGVLGANKCIFLYMSRGLSRSPEKDGWTSNNWMDGWMMEIGIGPTWELESLKEGYKGLKLDLVSAFEIFLSLSYLGAGSWRLYTTYHERMHVLSSVLPIFLCF
jgi:hypothetical protein